MADVVTGNKFYRNRLRVPKLWGSENGGLSLTWSVALTTVQHYRAACDVACRLLTSVIRVYCDKTTKIVITPSRGFHVNVS